MKIIQSLNFLKINIVLLVLLFCNFKTSAQKDTLQIGVMIEQPYVEIENGNYFGLNIDLVESLGRKLGFHCSYKAFENKSDITNALIKKEIDMIGNPISPDSKVLSKIEYTYPFLVSNLAIASPSPRFPIFTKLAKLIFSIEYLMGLAVIAIIILLFGFLTWRFERKKNEHQFPNSIKGLWEAFWWSAVTMTTVGYGDKIPKTIGGRATAVFWMFVALIIISGYTGTVVSILSKDQGPIQNSSMDDLAASNILLVKNHPTTKVLDAYGIEYRIVESVKSGLTELSNKKADFFIHDAHELYEAKIRDKVFSKITITLSNHSFVQKGFAMYAGHPLYTPFNEALIKETLTIEWKKKIRQVQNNKW